MVKLLLRDHSVSVSFKPLDVDVLDPRASPERGVSCSGHEVAGNEGLYYQ
jgi:hypothetical protein